MTTNQGVVSSSLTGGTKIRMMEREELIEFLRESLSIEIEMSPNWERENTYITSRVTLSLDGEEIMSDDSTINIG